MKKQMKKWYRYLKNRIAGTEELKNKQRILKKTYANCSNEEQRERIRRKWEGLRKERKQKEQKAEWILRLGILTLTLAIIGGCAGTAVCRYKKNKQLELEIQSRKEEEEARLLEEKRKEEELRKRPVEITMNFTGDCTLGTDEAFSQDTSLNTYYDLYGADYFLTNVRSLFEADDVTVVNMEGTLTEEVTREPKEYAFKGPLSFADILADSSVEAANMANNHSSDYGTKSFTDTIQTLEGKGVKTFGYDDVAVIEKKGIKIGLFGIYELRDHLERIPQVKSDIKKLKEEGVSIIVGVFHWGNELVTESDEYQKTLAHLAIDEGADLVVGHHPHVLQGIEEYKGKMIAYSLGNFCFGGNSAPRDMDCIIFQQRFTLVEGAITDSSYEIIPCSISSAYGINNYQPRLLEGDEAENVLKKIRERSN